MRWLEWLLYCDVESKWKNDHITTFAGQSLYKNRDNCEMLSPQTKQSRRMESTWIDRVKNEALYRAKWERNILHTIEGRKASFIVHIVSWDCLLKYGIQEKMEGGE